MKSVTDYALTLSEEKEMIRLEARLARNLLAEGETRAKNFAIVEEIRTRELWVGEVESFEAFLESLDDPDFVDWYHRNRNLAEPDFYDGLDPYRLQEKVAKGKRAINGRAILWGRRVSQ